MLLTDYEVLYQNIVLFIFIHIAIFTVLYNSNNFYHMKPEEQNAPVEETTQQTSVETDGVPPADKPRPPKNPDTEEVE